MVVRSARTALPCHTTALIPAGQSVRSLDAQFLASAAGPITPRAMRRLQTLVATSAEEAPRPRPSLSLVRHSSEAKNATTHTCTRSPSLVVNALAQSIAKDAGQNGVLVVPRAEAAASHVSSKSMCSLSMVARSATTNMRRLRTGHAQRCAALLTVKENGANLTNALKSARIAVLTVQLAHKSRPSMSLLRPSAMVHNAHTSMGKFESRLATSTAALRIAKDLGASSASAPPLVETESTRSSSQSPIKLPSVARSVSLRMAAASLRLALAHPLAQLTAPVCGILSADAPLSVASMETRVSRSLISLNSCVLSTEEPSASMMPLWSWELQTGEVCTRPRFARSQQSEVLSASMLMVMKTWPHATCMLAQSDTTALKVRIVLSMLLIEASFTVIEAIAEPASSAATWS